jgi:hypothetical protein
MLELDKTVDSRDGSRFSILQCTAHPTMPEQRFECDLELKERYKVPVIFQIIRVSNGNTVLLQRSLGAIILNFMSFFDRRQLWSGC